ncbi:aldehyde dehydrogenase family protein [Acidobacteria bacterium AH-259-G07]|nr:aldehyde dehydrogenase family protein [Acidobacteria bacterium AH-259-G07]
MKMFIHGQWQDRAKKIEVKNPYDQSVIDTVPWAGTSDVDEALAGAVQGADMMRKMPAYERARILRATADLITERIEDFARIVSTEEGKILAEARLETSRAAEIIQLSAEEAKRLTGEVLPLDAAPGGAGRIGFTLRVPCGVVAAISPFNFPLHLVCHKVGPALAAGNAVVIKPASDTPLSALKLVEVLLEAGLPPQAVACLTGPGAEVGDCLCADKRVRKITFTGSYEVGEHICKVAGMKKITMELGSNSPLIIMDDADLDRVAEATVATGYSNAGQVCISAQRVLTDGKVYEDFLGRLKSRVEDISVGDQLSESTKMGPMIREADAVRVGEWIQEAVSGGARMVTGGERQGTLLQPTVVADVDPGMRISRDELFGPALAVTRFDDIDQAITLANDTRYGLSAGIFTQDIDRAIRFAQEVDSGNLHINWGPQWRADLMPYGGLKDSGMGKEGPKYAVQEMTELKMVIIHLKQ